MISAIAYVMFRRTVVYEYSVKRELSKQSLQFQAGINASPVGTIVGYRGRIWVDHEDNRVLRDVWTMTEREREQFRAIWNAESVEQAMAMLNPMLKELSVGIQFVDDGSGVPPSYVRDIATTNDRDDNERTLR